MKQRYLNEVLSRLERVMNIGFVEITTGELVYWYEQVRLTVNIWRDIDDRWRDDLGQAVPLFVCEWNGILTFIWADGLTTNNKWFKDVRTRAGRNIQDAGVYEVEEDVEA